MMSNFDVLLWSSERVDDQLTVVLTYGDGKDVARLLKSQWQLPPVGFPSLVQLPPREYRVLVAFWASLCSSSPILPE